MLCVSQKPLTQFLSSIRGIPGVVLQIGEVREFGIATGGFDGGDELFGGADGDDVVLAAMEGPDGHGFEGVADFIGGRAEAADWGDRGKPVGVFGADGPGSRAALREAGEVDA